MIKTILKEMIIILLLCAVIILLLSVLFYDDNPISKVVPNKIAYTTPESVQNALEEETIDNGIQLQNRVYVIEGADLNIYQKDKTYDPSKENPFATTIENDAGTTAVGTGTSNNNPSGGQAGNNQNTGNTGSTPSSPKTGLK